MTGARVTRPASDTAHSLAITPHTHSGEKKKQVHTETAPRPEKLYSRLSKTRSRLQVLQAADRHTGSVHRTDHLAAMERHHLQRHPPWPGSKPASTRRRRSREPGGHDLDDSTCEIRKQAKLSPGASRCLGHRSGGNCLPRGRGAVQAEGTFCLEWGWLHRCTYLLKLSHLRTRRHTSHGTRPELGRMDVEQEASKRDSMPAQHTKSLEVATLACKKLRRLKSQQFLTRERGEDAGRRAGGTVVLPGKTHVQKLRQEPAWVGTRGWGLRASNSERENLQELCH